MTSHIQTNEWLRESNMEKYGFCQTVEIQKVLFEQKSTEQSVLVLEHEHLGKILVLDGIVQLTEKDEYIYHEMMAHVPLIAHPEPKNVLIIGGGDGGVLREVLKHPVEKATLVEIDKTVIDLSRKYFPQVPNGSFDNDRAEVVITDGFVFLEDKQNCYDVVIVDSSDFVGPNSVLFSEEFYRRCQKSLKTDGIMIAMNGSSFILPDELKTAHQHRRKLFKDAYCYQITVPTYYCGQMAIGWGADNPALRKMSLEDITRKVAQLKLKTRYYNPAIHAAAFVLPNYIREIVN